MAFTWNSGALWKKVPAEVVGGILEDLASKDELTPKNLVEVSRAEDAPLHDYFEWDDGVAADKYRETQARYIIRTIEYVEETVEERPTRAFVAVSRDTSYKDIRVVVKSEDLTEKLLSQCKREMESFINKYDTLNAYIGNVLVAMNDAIEGLE